jgi:hypothetical protein
MLTSGYFLIDRKVLSSFRKPYPESLAWIWMISQADFIKGEHYGKISTTIRQLGDVWGWNKMKVSRTLKKWSNPNNPRITCKYAVFPRPINTSLNYVTGTVTESVTGDVTELTEITLLNYKQYQDGKKKSVTMDVTEGVTEGVTVSENYSSVLSNKETNINNKNPYSPQKGTGKRKRLPPACKNPEELEIKMNSLETSELPALKDKYEPKGLDVDAWWQNFREYAINGNATKPFPNPANWRDWPKAMRWSCETALQRGWYQKDSNTDYREEVMRRATK